MITGVTGQGYLYRRGPQNLDDVAVSSIRHAGHSKKTAKRLVVVQATRQGQFIPGESSSLEPSSTQRKSASALYRMHNSGSGATDIRLTTDPTTLQLLDSL